jgi:hypothetical protein
MRQDYAFDFMFETNNIFGKINFEFLKLPEFPVDQSPASLGSALPKPETFVFPR